MATTKDLSNLIDHEMGGGQGSFLVRLCQDAGLLPKAKRGGWRSMEQLTAEQLADFVIAVAGTRAVGERNANGARAAIERFAALPCDWGDWEGGRGVSTLREDIAYFLCKHQYELEIEPDTFSPLWILFSNDRRDPWVEIRLMSDDGEAQQTLMYHNPASDTDDGPVTEAVIIYYRLFTKLEWLLLK